MVKFFFLSDMTASACVGDWDELRDYIAGYDDFPALDLDRVTLEEIETPDGSVFDVVLLDGRPVGTCRVPASGDLLELLEPRRVRHPAVVKALAAFDAAIAAVRAAHDQKAA